MFFFLIFGVFAVALQRIPIFTRARAAVLEEGGLGGETAQFVNVVFRKAWTFAINAKIFHAKN